MVKSINDLRTLIKLRIKNLEERPEEDKDDECLISIAIHKNILEMIEELIEK
jgi:hypothetical protein